MISVIVSTKDRPELLIDCVRSILANQRQPDEIIIIDQSKNDELCSRVIVCTHSAITYHYDHGIGLSRARNIGLTLAKGKILVFTDDDCLVDQKWLENICLSFQENKDVSGVFGSIFPYKPWINKDKICPCTFQKRQKKLLDRPCLHYKNIGFGNNMAFRREIFDKIGGFKEWLGVGAVGKSAEDAEFALRVLLNGYKLLYDPNVKVYHNRWLTEEESRRQRLSYVCGEVASYGYFAFNGIELGRKVIKDNFIDSYNKLKWGIKLLALLRKKSFQVIRDALAEFWFRLRGLAIAFWFSKKEPLNLPVFGKD